VALEQLGAMDMAADDAVHSGLRGCRKASVLKRCDISYGSAEVRLDVLGEGPVRPAQPLVHSVNDSIQSQEAAPSHVSDRHLQRSALDQSVELVTVQHQQPLAGAGN